MTIIRLFLKFVEKEFIAGLLLLILLYSLLPLSEILLLLYIGGILGDFLTLACAASTGLLGVLVAFTQFKTVLGTLKEKVRAGTYPGREFIGIAGILAGGILLLTPGFITDLFGFILFIPVSRNLIGKLITKRIERQLKEVYEYLKLYEI
jgi:UPF0716 protein FxsA